MPRFIEQKNYRDLTTILISGRFSVKIQDCGDAALSPDARGSLDVSGGGTGREKVFPH
jgi:hypothetical protein